MLRSGPATWTSYEVNAPTLAGVVTLLVGRREAGRCRWALGYTYGSVSRGRPVDLEVTLAITIEMPRWTQRSTASAAHGAAWDRFYAALSTHETGHERLAREHTERLHERMTAARVSALRGLYAAGKRGLDRASAAYDRSTRHGVSQGTVITIP